MTKKMEVIQALRFTLANEEDIERMLIHLNDYGYVVIADVASEIEIEQQKNRFWNYIEGLDAGKSGEEIRISRSNVETWKDENWVGNHSTGIIRSPNFCHSDFMWTSRTLPKVKQAFAEVWKNDDLIVSFDAGNAFRPWKYNPQWVTEGNWWHVDQNSRKGPSRQGRVCVQGLVTYYDVNEETGGLCVIPGSHLFHNELCDRSPSGKLMHDYVYIGEDDPILRLNPPVIVGAKAGDLILWDSRLVHCNCPSPKATSKEDLKSNVPSKVSSASSMGKISWTNLKLSNPKLGGELGGGHAETAVGEEKENSIAATTPSSDLEWINISEGSSNHRHQENMNDFELIDDNQGDSSSPRQPQQQQLQGKVSANSIALLTETTRQNESLNTEKISEPSADLIRLVSYVCMLPRSCATAAVIRSRKRGFLYKVPTSHWPTEMIPLYMTDYRQDHAVNWKEVSPEVMKLVGFSSLEIQLRRFRFSEMCREVYNMVM